MGNAFTEITIIICLAAVLAIIFKLLKQPLILAYILAGIIIGPFGKFQLGSRDLLQAMGELGITFLLFMLGLELKIQELKSIGKVAFSIGISQIIITGVSAYFFAAGLGFSPIASFYISAALTFSSTIIVVKLLSDKKDLGSLYGKISVAVLLLQDLFAIFVLMFLSTFNSIGLVISPIAIALVFVKGIGVIGFVLLLSTFIFPKLMGSIAKSSETLFLVSIAWVLGLTGIISSPFIGFPIEIGGLMAGLALANSIANYQIVARVRSLRDFFITIFFVFLAIGMSFNNLGKVLVPAVWLSLFVIIGKPLIVMIVMGILGYRRRTSFLTGITMGQISEFSLIVVFLGNKLGHLQGDAVSLITIISIISFVSSNYIIAHADGLYRYLHPKLKIFERKSAHKEKTEEDSPLEDHVVLIGVHRVGKSILEALRDGKETVVAVDFNPDVVQELKDKKISTFFGDITDMEILDHAKLNKAKLVISTVPDMEDNLQLIKELNRHNRLAKIIVLAQYDEDAKILYKAGADYVILPHLAGGRQIAKILKEDSLRVLESFKEKDLNYIRQ